MSTGWNTAIVQQHEAERQRRLEEERQRQLAEERARLAQLAQQRAEIQAQLERQRHELSQKLEAVQADHAARTAHLEAELKAQLDSLAISLARQEQAFQQAQTQLQTLQRRIESIERMDTQTYAVFQALTQSFSAFAQLEVQAVEQEGEGYLIRFATDADQEAFAKLTPQQDDRVALFVDLTDMYGPTACQSLISSVNQDIEAQGIRLQPIAEHLDDSDKPNWERVRRGTASRA
ncbi:MAG: hypothetical protein RML95_15630 [Anaerolineae bacterium]|nr:hypothetical protein [Anaerolineae bacterium]